MAYYNIEKRLKSDGTPRYRCNVIIKEKGVITYRESKTFPKHAHAKTWGTQKVMELDLYGIPSSNAVDGLTVRDLLHKYLNDPNAGGKAGRTKRYVLELLMDSDISAIKLSELTENDVIEHCRLRTTLAQVQQQSATMLVILAVFWMRPNLYTELITHQTRRKVLVHIYLNLV